MRHVHVIRVLVLTFALASAAIGAVLGERSYRLPLVEPFGIERRVSQSGSSLRWGTYQLTRTISRDGTASEMLVPDIDRVAVRDRLIFGTTTSDGGFIVDARDAEALPQTFAALDAWRETLRSAGVETPDALLAKPDALAAALPARTLRPWNYRLMNGRLGLDDAAWCLAGQLVSLVVAAAVGRFALRTRSSIWSVSFLGAFGAMVSHILYDGQGACMLLGMTPIVYLFATVGRDDLDDDMRPTWWRPPNS